MPHINFIIIFQDVLGVVQERAGKKDNAQEGQHNEDVAHVQWAAANAERDALIAALAAERERSAGLVQRIEVWGRIFLEGGRGDTWDNSEQGQP